MTSSNGSSPNGTKKAILYARVSTDDQADGGYSLPSQLTELRKYAAAYGFKVVREIEDDASGELWITDRPGGKQLDAALTKRTADAVIVHTVDRLSRHQARGALVVEGWLEAGAEVYCLDYGQVKDPNDIAFVIKGWQGADERKKIIERTSRGRRQKIESGIFPGYGIGAFGYRNEGHKKTTHLVIVAEEAEVVRQIFHWYTKERIGVGEIAKRLTAQAVPSCADIRGLTWRKRRGAGVWSPGMVYPILRREAYTGRWRAFRYRIDKGKRRKRADDEQIELTCPAIIDDATWNEAQRRLVAGRRSYRGQLKHDYLLRGMLKCSCGYAVTGSPHSSRGHVYSYYKCHSKDRAHSLRECDVPMFSAAKWDRVVWKWVVETWTDPTEVERKLRQQQANQEEDSVALRKRFDAVTAKIERVKAKQERLLDIYLDLEKGDDEGKTDLDRKKAELKRLRGEYEAQAEELREEIANKVFVTDEVIRAVLDPAHLEEWRMLTKIDVDDWPLEQKRRRLDELHFQGRLAFEDGIPIIHVRTSIDTERLSLQSANV